ncbi:MAG: tripartite tricarboxylate transporter substrate binding protein [Betaproteobacteria bacterium]|jgi:putative tricarboxylic transport membrane protein|nr:tripartite tricarboxylate transporter substrate binding protein [Betaproteobacteria bacterium]
MNTFATIAATLVLAAASAAASAQGAWKPERNVEIIVGSSAGTGTDRTARLIQKIWQDQKALPVPVAVVNRPGGGGAVSWAYLAGRGGDAHALLVTSYNLVTNHITGRSPQNYSDFTLISLLVSEYIGFAVRPDSPYRTLAELAKALRENPDAITFGTSSAAGGANHIATGLFARAAGADLKRLKVVIYNGGGEALAAMLGGHVTVWVNSASSIATPFAAGTIRPLAIASPQRMPGALAKLPTAREAGFPMVADNWRLVIAPKGLTPAQVAYWDQGFRTLTQSKEWNDDLAAANMPNSYRNSAETTKYIAEEYNDIRDILVELGLAKPAR